MDELVAIVEKVNPHRSASNLNRRLLKITEELGETSEAYLSVSSPHNYKKKSWLDFREESIDVLIVLIDVALTKVNNVEPPYPVIFQRPGVWSHNEHDEITYAMFEIGAKVSASYVAFDSGDIKAFHRAISGAIQFATNLCLTLIPEDGGDFAHIKMNVRELFEKKIDKWNRSLRVYAVTDDGK